MKHLRKISSLLLIVSFLLSPIFSTLATGWNLDDLRLYSRALFSSEVLSMYQTPGSGSTSSLIGHWKLDAFNEQRKYAGQEYDVDTGLSYMNARYYNGKAGRFVSQDPLTLKSPEKVLQDPQALNFYAYARNNPLVYVDNTGEFFETAWDIANVVYDAGRVVKNTAEIGIGAAKYGYGSLTNNQSLQNKAVSEMNHDLSDLKSAAVDIAFDTGSTLIPFVPAGLTKVGKAAENLRGTANPVIKKAVEYGKQQHNLMDYGSGVLKEQKLGNYRVDGLDKINKTIYELKPNTKQSINRGLKQLDKYVNTANKLLGEGYKGVLKTYKSLTNKKYK